MKKGWLYYLGLYTVCVALLNLIFLTFIYAVVNIILLVCEMPLFGIVEFGYSYLIGFIIFFILNLNVLIQFKRNQEE